MTRPFEGGPLAVGEPVVVVGGGHGGHQVAVSLRDNGFLGPVTIVGDEPDLPYERPPLSKAYLTAAGRPPDPFFRPRSFYDERGIRLVTGRAVTVDRAAGRLVLRSGAELPFAHLVLATGAEARPLAVPGRQRAGVHTLRTLADAARLRAALSHAQDVVVVGGGFVGLEVAAAAAKLGHRVTVVEQLSRLMVRVVAGEVGAHLARVHGQAGTSFLLGRQVCELTGPPDAAAPVSGVALDDGEVLHADLVVVGIGALPNTGLATEAGLAVDNGIAVDGHLLSSDPTISAIGDCAAYPSRHADRRLRLESVQNAAGHGRHVADRLTGRTTCAYGATPWFWSIQHEVRLQIAGAADPDDGSVLTADPATGAFSVLRVRDNRVTAVESVNRPADHVRARRMFDATSAPSVSDATAAGLPGPRL